MWVITNHNKYLGQLICYHLCYNEEDSVNSTFYLLLIFFFYIDLVSLAVPPCFVLDDESISKAKKPDNPGSEFKRYGKHGKLQRIGASTAM